ncbi:glycerophosphodiester phosphodiesterase [Adhaeribacter soli]|uniref:Glycerophosphodiester phosphodiesterase n=1 Tax=Adhaeribacter soli TaxID=2607655 RepID=A0A5N1IGY8_9BACT|nr:glycerophosphodiester phosphodiesterase [Adhaeribacter soli]KAA9324923.1 glycerophosphodiester phosphodiesterase [Adhaeribacter soli]
MSNTLKNNSPEIIGHRGAAGLVFENTLAGFQKAFELRLSLIELDVWKTIDGESVVFHDALLDRLTPAKGLIAEQTVAELQQIKLNNGDPIPTLKEVIALAKDYPVTLIVEVKAENAFAKTLELLEAELPYSRFVLGSFYHQPIIQLKKAKPELRTAIMFEGVPVDFDEYLAKVNPEFVVASKDTANAYLAETVKLQNRKLLFYTVNSEPEYTMLLKYAPFGIISDFPDLFLKS